MFNIGLEVVGYWFSFKVLFYRLRGNYKDIDVFIMERFGGYYFNKIIK